LVVVAGVSWVVSFVVVVDPCGPYCALVVCHRSLVGVVHPFVGRLVHVVVLLVLLDRLFHLGMVVSFLLVLLFRLGMVVSFLHVLLAFAIPFVVGRMASVGILAFVGSIVVHLPFAC